MDFTLCLTHDCNLRCAYCYAGRKTARSMMWQVARQAVDFCLDHTLKRAALTGRPPQAQLGYFGGEPLLEWPLLKRSAEYAMEQAERAHIALKKTVTTNMTLLDDEKAAWFRDQGFYLGLSLDGNADMHDTLRRSAAGAGSHAAAAQALRFYRGPAPQAEVIVVVDPRNVAHLADSVQWLLTGDIRSIALNPNFYVTWPGSSLAVWRDACERIADLYIEHYRQSIPVRINIIDGKIRTRIKEGYELCDRCGFGDNEIAIAPGGNIYPCERIVGDDTNEELRIGNVLTGFDSAKRARIVACRGNTVAECADCPIRDRCMNWCSCINYATTGAINRVDGLVCHHERMVIAVADRVGATLFAEKNPAFLAKFYAA
jgi:uncharacterized protein